MTKYSDLKKSLGNQMLPEVMFTLLLALANHWNDEIFRYIIHNAKEQRVYDLKDYLRKFSLFFVFVCPKSIMKTFTS